MLAGNIVYRSSRKNQVKTNVKREAGENECKKPAREKERDCFPCQSLIFRVARAVQLRERDARGFFVREARMKMYEPIDDLEMLRVL